jgi:two-component system sensor histidine kinase/response regulator
MPKSGLGHLLVVDDNEMNRDMLARRLQREGYTVTAADSGYQALELLKAEKFDLIVLDVMMPGLNGYQALQIIRETHSIADLPVILATAKDQSEDVIEGLRLGANDYVTKPIDFPVLMARLQTHLQLKQLAQLKDEFLRIASHDLKSPLSSILMSAHIILEYVPPGTVMAQDNYELLTFIVRRSEEMQRIVTDFLDFQAMADGKLSLDIKPTDLNQIARSVTDDNQEYAHAKSIVLKSKLSGPLPQINADAARIAQVAQNLIGNAIKFGLPGTEVIVRTFAEGEAVMLEVRDSGPGLTNADLSKIFVKYARLSNRPTGGEKSSGLGLAICKQIIELHGGKIGVRNNPDKGATFWFSLPVN